MTTFSDIIFEYPLQGRGLGGGKLKYVYPFNISFASGVSIEEIGNYHYQIQTSDDELFSVIILDVFSKDNQDNWYYFAGNTFEPIPENGINPIYDGGVGFYLSSITNGKYYRVRSYDILSESYSPWQGGTAIPYND